MIEKSRYGRSARRPPLLVAAVAIAAAFATHPAAAQQLGGMPPAMGATRAPMLAPGLQLHAVNPSLSLSAPATSPLQQQTQDDYATSLMQAQRQLMQQTPSGDNRAELSIGNQLNGFTGPR
jgi:hypothetical protein